MASVANCCAVRASIAASEQQPPFSGRSGVGSFEGDEGVKGDYSMNKTRTQSAMRVKHYLL
jgi:hypothetical protein